MKYSYNHYKAYTWVKALLPVKMDPREVDENPQAVRINVWRPVLIQIQWNNLLQHFHRQFWKMVSVYMLIFVVLVWSYFWDNQDAIFPAENLHTHENFFFYARIIFGEPGRREYLMMLSLIVCACDILELFVIAFFQSKIFIDEKSKVFLVAYLRDRIYDQQGILWLGICGKNAVCGNIEAINSYGMVLYFGSDLYKQHLSNTSTTTSA